MCGRGVRPRVGAPCKTATMLLDRLRVAFTIPGCAGWPARCSIGRFEVDPLFSDPAILTRFTPAEPLLPVVDG